MKYRKLDANGDYLFGGEGQFFVNDPEGVAQAIRTRLLLMTNEWFLDANEGTPYDEDIRGYGTAATRDPAIIDRILGTPGVQSLLQYSSSLDKNRLFQVSARVATLFGEVQVTTSIGAPPSPSPPPPPPPPPPPSSPDFELRSLLDELEYRSEYEVNFPVLAAQTGEFSPLQTGSQASISDDELGVTFTGSGSASTVTNTPTSAGSANRAVEVKINTLHLGRSAVGFWRGDLSGISNYDAESWVGGFEPPGDGSTDDVYYESSTGRIYGADPVVETGTTLTEGDVLGMVRYVNFSAPIPFGVSFYLNGVLIGTQSHSGSTFSHRVLVSFQS